MSPDVVGSTPARALLGVCDRITNRQYEPLDASGVISEPEGLHERNMSKPFEIYEGFVTTLGDPIFLVNALKKSLCGFGVEVSRGETGNDDPYGLARGRAVDALDEIDGIDH